MMPVFLLYGMIGLFVGWAAANATLDSKGPDKDDFGDFGTWLYILIGVALIWPVVVAAWLLWQAYRAAR